VKALERGLEQSGAVALVVSPESMASGWVEEEYNRAVTLAKQKSQPLQLIPVLLRASELPGFLAGREPVDFRESRQYAESVWRLVWGITGKQPPRVLALDASALPPLPGKYVPEPAPLPRGSRMHIRRNPQRVGRTEQLRALAAALHVQGRAAIGQVASVTGLGGIGKTQLATEFVHRYGQFFAGGVFWLGFSDPSSVPNEIARCGGPEHLGLWTDESAPDIATQVERARSIFAGPEPRLLVFDNCEDEALLVEICAELGDLPLALHLAGSFLARYRTVVTPADYLVQLRSPALLDHPSLQGRGAESSPTGHVLHAGKTLALSWDRLDPGDAVDAIARDLLHRAACLAPGEPIPHALLVATIGAPEGDLGAKLAQADALRRLFDLGLLEKPEPDTYRIHRLVTDFARHTSGDHATARASVEQALLDEVTRVNTSGFPARLLRWQPHLRAATDVARAREDEQAARLCAALDYHFHEIGDYGAARTYCEHALAVRGKQYGPEHHETATSLNNLALLLRDQGALAEARPLYERALAICEASLGPEHPSTRIVRRNWQRLLES
jgi:tetratricopeptide (TPR) repeat protein